MPFVFKEDIKRLVENEIHPTFAKRRGFSRDTPTITEYYEELGKDLEEYVGKDRGRWLQKDYYDRVVYESRIDVLNLHRKTLDDLTAYAKQNKKAKYQDYFLVNKSVKGLLAEKMQMGFDRMDKYESGVSHDQLSKPEFPVGNPAYPATPHIPMYISDYQRLWVKDESVNPTGTHKDRMAWEVVRFYRNKLQEGWANLRLSILTSGAAGMAIQNLLKRFGLPRLKVLVDKRIKPEILLALEDAGCEIYKEDLSARQLNSKDILKLTKSSEHNGIDVTFSIGYGLNAIRNDYYDWLAFEIINQNAQYCVVPFGSGNLMRNILNTATKVLENGPSSDSRFLGDADVLKSCIFFGATSTLNKPDTVMDKLYAPYNNYKSFNLTEEFSLINPESRVIPVSENSVLKAHSEITKLGIDSEYSGIAGFALLKQEPQLFDKSKKILVVNTGLLKLR